MQGLNKNNTEIRTILAMYTEASKEHSMGTYVLWHNSCINLQSITAASTIYNF